MWRRTFLGIIFTFIDNAVFYADGPVITPGKALDAYYMVVRVTSFLLACVMCSSRVQAVHFKCALPVGLNEAR